MLEFKNIDEEGIKLINQIWAQTCYYGSEYSYTYMFSWFARHERDCLKYCYSDGIVFISFCNKNLPIFSGEKLYLPPLTTLDKVELAYKMLTDYAREACINNFKIIQVPHYHTKLIDSSIFDIQFMDDAAEYLYYTHDIIELPGKKYHGKRGHIAKFVKSFPQFEFREYTDRDYEAVISLFDEWKAHKDGKINGIKHEFNALNTALEMRKRFSLKAGVLLVENTVIGFSLGEITPNNVGIVHFEKANIEFEGAYSMLTNSFAKKFLFKTRLINRQEDMGIEGLRKSKQSYYPIGFAKKALCSYKNDNI